MPRHGIIPEHLRDDPSLPEEERRRRAQERERLFSLDPDVAAFDAYRADPRRVALGAQRERVIARTEVWRGAARRAYGSGGST